MTALPVDAATSAAHDATRHAIAAPGAWWSGADRLAIVRAARTAPTCAYCAQRDEPSFAAIDGEHDNDGELPPIAVEAVHAIRNDSGRLTRAWFDDVIDMGLLPEAYVELVAVTASSVILDTFAQGIGLDMPQRRLGRRPRGRHRRRRRRCRRSYYMAPDSQSPNAPKNSLRALGTRGRPGVRGTSALSRSATVWDA